MAKPVNRSFARALVTGAVSTLGATALTIITGAVIARALGPEGRGALSAFQLGADTAFALLGLSLGTGALLRMKDSDADRYAVFTAYMWLVGLTMILSITTAALYFTYLIPDAGAFAPLIPLLALHMGANIFNVSAATLDRVDLNFDMLAVERIITPMIYLCALLAMIVVDGLTITAAIVLIALSKLPVAVRRFYRYKDFFAHVVTHLPRRADLRPMLMTSLRQHLPSITSILAAQLDRLLAVSVLPLALFGQYIVAYTVVGSGLELATKAINHSLLAHLIGLKRSALQLRCARVLRIVTACIVASSVGVALFGEVLVTLVYGDQFTFAGELTRILIFAIGPLPLIALQSDIARALEKPGIVGIADLFGVVAMVVSVTIFADGTVPTFIACMAAANVIRLFVLSVWLQVGPLGISPLAWAIPRLSDALLIRDRLLTLKRPG